MAVLEQYLNQYGRPLAFYTDKASLFQTAVKTKRGEQREGKDQPEMAPTQIGRALRELGIRWIPAHSPQAKGRVERSFGTAQDRLVKELRLAGASTFEQANAYLEQEFIPWWNETLTVTPASADDAHQRLAKQHDEVTGGDAQRYVAQGFQGTEMARDPIKVEHRCVNLCDYFFMSMPTRLSTKRRV